MRISPSDFEIEEDKAKSDLIKVYFRHIKSLQI